MISYETYQAKNDWEQDVLSYYQFQDDFGESSDVRFKDRIVTARHNHTCTYCGGKVEAGSVYRYEVYKFDGDVRTYKSCQYCCDAMVKSWDDGGKALERRAARRAIFDKVSG